jgi:hypothetical protein
MADTTLDDLTLEMMELNQTTIGMDKRITLSNDYLNNITANSWASFEQLHIIANILSGNQLAALEKAKEDGALQQKMIDALKGVQENTKEKKKAKELDLSLGPAGILGGLMGFLGGFIKGYIQNFSKVAKGFYNLVKAGFSVLGDWMKASWKWVKQTDFGKSIGNVVSTIIKNVKAEIDLWGDSIKGLFKGTGESSILGKVRGAWESVKNFFIKPFDNIADEFRLWKEYLGPVVTKIKGLLAPIFDLGARMDDVKGFFTIIKDTVKGWVQNVFSKVKDMLGVLGGGDGALAKIGKFFGKFFAPVTFLLTLWDTVKGAIDGYEKGGIMGAVKGALTGFLSSIVGEPLNLLKGLASWIAEKLGFTEFSKMLDSFDFAALIKSGIEGIYNWFATLFTDPGAALTTLWNNLVGEGGLMDLLFKPIDMLINWVMEKFDFKAPGDKDFSVGNLVRGLWNGIIEGVASFVEGISWMPDAAADKIRALKAGEATFDVKTSATPEKVVPPTGDTLKTAASEKRNTDTVAEAARDTAIMSGVGSTAVSGGGGSTTVNSSNSNATVNISTGSLPDRTDWSVMSGSFGLAP